MGNVNSADDAKRYRDGYPGKEDDAKILTNLEFYSNKRASKPEGDTIENIHKKWLGKYGLLEAHHGYIQWLFPIREDGLNHYAEQLQLHEAKAIASDPILQGRIITSYELMLNFYGMKLVDRKTGKIERNPENWKERYSHLNHSFHNYLRITRILKCLGEVGLEHFKIHFVKHVLKEIYENKQLTNCRESCTKYWATVLRIETERQECIDFVEKYEPSSTKTDNNKYNLRDSDSDEEIDDRRPAALGVRSNKIDQYLTKRNSNEAPDAPKIQPNTEVKNQNDVKEEKKTEEEHEAHEDKSSDVKKDEL